MARAYDGQSSRKRLLQTAINMFLDKGYHKTQIRDICAGTGLSTGTFYNAFGSKEGVLAELIAYMSNHIFNKARTIAAESASPIMAYAMENAIRLAITETSENFRDIYIEAYSYLSISAYICEKNAKELYRIFGSLNPGLTEADFYEMEIASSGILRGYMSVPCTQYFTFERKLNRFFNVIFDVYHVPDEVKESITSQIISREWEPIALQIVKELTAAIKDNFAYDKLS